MQSLFELKTKLTVDMSVFEQMKKTAEIELSKAETGQYTQAMVFLSAKGNEYNTLIKNALSEEKTDEIALLERMKNSNDTEIHYALCLWQDGGLDIPSYRFRELLCKLNPKNTELSLLVMTADGISEIKVSTTMK